MVRFGHKTLLIIILAATLAGESSAQSTGRPARGSRPLTLTQSVEPSFRVEPVVLRYKGRRGEVLPFEFEITSTGKSMDVELKPVNLRQELNGVILFDESSAPPSATRIRSPTKFKLKPGESQRIRGTITVPLARTNYLSFGILVRDKGRRPEFNQGQDSARTEAGIRFVTQYVLRVDVEVNGSSDSELRRLRFQNGGIRSKNGMPVAETILVNDTDYAFEFHVRGVITSSVPTVRPKPFLLRMPSRSEMKEPERFLVRMMPHSRLRLESPVSSVLFPGQQQFHVGISNGRREVVGSDFTVSTSHGDFPALATTTAVVGTVMSVSPAYLSLGQLRGNQRVAAIKFHNHSGATSNVHLTVESIGGEPLPLLKLLPSEFDIRAGKSKHVRAVLQSQADLKRPEYGYVRIRAVDGDGNESRHALPMSLLFGPPEAADVAVSAISLDDQHETTAFLVTATNNSRAFVPIHGRLEITDQHGRKMQLTAGYGKWMHPDETVSLRFVPTVHLLPGQYQLALQMKTREGEAPLERTVIVNLSEVEAPPANTLSDSAKGSQGQNGKRSL